MTATFIILGFLGAMNLIGYISDGPIFGSAELQHIETPENIRLNALQSDTDAEKNLKKATLWIATAYENFALEGTSELLYYRTQRDASKYGDSGDAQRIKQFAAMRIDAKYTLASLAISVYKTGGSDALAEFERGMGDVASNIERHKYCHVSRRPECQWLKQDIDAIEMIATRDINTRDAKKLADDALRIKSLADSTDGKKEWLAYSRDRIQKELNRRKQSSGYNNSSSYDLNPVYAQRAKYVTDMLREMVNSIYQYRAGNLHDLVEPQKNQFQGGY